MFMNSVDVSNNNISLPIRNNLPLCRGECCVTYLPKVPYKPVAVVVPGVFLQIMLM